MAKPQQEFLRRALDEPIQFAMDLKLITTDPPRCRTCGECTTMINDKKKINGKIWRCPKHKGFKMPVVHDSWFSNSQISISTHLQLMFYWAFETPVTTAVEFTGVSTTTAVQWYQYSRDACSWWLTQPENRVIYGNDGGVVEIDESLIRTPKHHRGHAGEPRWVFGIYDRNTKFGYLQFVPDRSATTLLPIIQKMVAPGATINSDGWAAYKRIANLNVEPAFSHKVIVHENNFVDPDDADLHTNNIEAFWKAANACFKRMNGTNSDMISSHLDAFMFRDRVKRSREEKGACHYKVLMKLIDSIVGFQRELLNN